MSTSERMAELGIELPPVPAPLASYVPARRVGDLVFSSGQLPTRDGRPVYTGKLGQDLTVEQGQEAARVAALNCLAAVAAEIGSLDEIEAVVKLTGYVASAPGFVDQPLVANGASTLLEQVFGEAGKHARAAVGVAELPRGVPVEVELIVCVRS